MIFDNSQPAFTCKSSSESKEVFRNAVFALLDVVMAICRQAPAEVIAVHWELMRPPSQILERYEVCSRMFPGAYMYSWLLKINNRKHTFGCHHRIQPYIDSKSKDTVWKFRKQNRVEPWYELTATPGNRLRHDFKTYFRLYPYLLHELVLHSG